MCGAGEGGGIGNLSCTRSLQGAGCSPNLVYEKLENKDSRQSKNLKTTFEPTLESAHISVLSAIFVRSVPVILEDTTEPTLVRNLTPVKYVRTLLPSQVTFVDMNKRSMVYNLSVSHDKQNENWKFVEL